MKNVKFTLAITQIFVLLFATMGFLTAWCDEHHRYNYAFVEGIAFVLGFITINFMAAIYLFSAPYPFQTAKDLEQTKKELSKEILEYKKATNEFYEMAEKLANALPPPHDIHNVTGLTRVSDVDAD